MYTFAQKECEYLLECYVRTADNLAHNYYNKVTFLFIFLNKLLNVINQYA